MSLHRYLKKLKHLDFLIRRRATGNQQELARKMNVSKSGLNALLKEMRDLGFPLRYDREKGSYYYQQEGRMVESLFEETLTTEEMRGAAGGMMLRVIPFSLYGKEIFQIVDTIDLR